VRLVLKLQETRVQERLEKKQTRTKGVRAQKQNGDGGFEKLDLGQTTGEKRDTRGGKADPRAV